MVEYQFIMNNKDPNLILKKQIKRKHEDKICRNFLKYNQSFRCDISKTDKTFLKTN